MAFGNFSGSNKGVWRILGIWEILNMRIQVAGMELSGLRWAYGFRDLGEIFGDFGIRVQRVEIGRI